MPRVNIELTERDIAPVSIAFRVIAALAAVTTLVHRYVYGPNEQSDVSIAVATFLFLLVAILFNPRVTLMATNACTKSSSHPLQFEDDSDVEAKEASAVHEVVEITPTVANAEVS
jgi:hypothetical protein